MKVLNELEKNYIRMFLFLVKAYVFGAIFDEGFVFPINIRRNNTG